MPIIDTQNNQYSKNVYRNMFFTSFEEFLVGTAPSMLETLIVLVMILPFILVGMNNFGINIGFDFIVRCFSTVNVAAAYIGTLSGILFKQKYSLCKICTEECGHYLRRIDKSFNGGMEKNIMNDEYRIEVDTGNGGYGFTDTLAELLVDVELEYGKKEVEKVSIWTKSSKEGDEYVSEDKRMHIWNMGS